MHDAVVLDGASRQVDGVRVYGLGDPVFTPNKLSALDDARIADIVGSVGLRILGDVEASSGVPDIVAVHDDRMAQAVAGYVPLVISGASSSRSFSITYGRSFVGSCCAGP